LAGGGSDLSPFCDEFGGFVLNATINLFVYATLEPTHDGKIRFVAADREESFECSVEDEIGPNDVLPLHRAVYKRIVSEWNGGRPISARLTTYSDVAAGSGLGSSSTLVVAMLEAFKEMLNLPLGEYEVARLAYQIERHDAGMPGGRQDQYAATFGGFNFMEFYACERAIINPLRIKPAVVNELEASIVLYNTEMPRGDGSIIDEQARNLASRNLISLDATHSLKREAVDMKESVLTGNMTRFAEVLGHGWEDKKRTASMVTNAELDAIFESALAAGAVAGKVSGAGGGGYMIFMVDPLRRLQLCRALRKHGGQLISMQFTEGGSRAWRR
jgi:D-glycero-alpha-D-manno-heptose-7-phosphate kinase